MKVISIRDNPEYKEIAIRYLQQSWPEAWAVIYEDCVEHCLDAENPLPQWYLLKKDYDIIGCAGLVTNDFISRMDLYPWLCALYIAEEQRGHNYAKMLIDKAAGDSKRYGFRYLNLSTRHIGYYEKFGFDYIGQGYQPWHEESRIYQIKL